MCGRIDGEIENVLLKRNADVNHADTGGRTPLMALLASREGPEADLVRLLVEKGAKANTRDKSGRTAIDAARDMRDATIRNAVLGP